MAVTLQTDPPPFDMSEVINQWFDFNPETLSTAALYPLPTYSEEEVSAVIVVREAMDRLCDATPRTITDDGQVLALPEWRAVEAAARHARHVMSSRGRLPED